LPAILAESIQVHYRAVDQRGRIVEALDVHDPARMRHEELERVTVHLAANLAPHLLAPALE
jgi:hypothetical protein